MGSGCRGAGRVSGWETERRPSCEGLDEALVACKLSTNDLAVISERHCNAVRMVVHLLGHRGTALHASHLAQQMPGLVHFWIVRRAPFSGDFSSRLNNHNLVVCNRADFARIQPLGPLPRFCQKMGLHSDCFILFEQLKKGVSTLR